MDFTLKHISEMIINIYFGRMKHGPLRKSARIEKSEICDPNMAWNNADIKFFDLKRQASCRLHDFFNGDFANNIFARDERANDNNKNQDNFD